MPTEMCSPGFVQRSHNGRPTTWLSWLWLCTHLRFHLVHSPSILRRDRFPSQEHLPSLVGRSRWTRRAQVVLDPAPRSRRRRSTSCRRTRSWSPSSPRPGRRRCAGPTPSASKGRQRWLFPFYGRKSPGRRCLPRWGWQSRRTATQLDSSNQRKLLTWSTSIQTRLYQNVSSTI